MSTKSSPSLFPSLESISPLPITHLHGLQAYLPDWRADHKHAHRPPPLTPARMAPEGRRLSTAIPRPLSGTSRRLTSGQRQTESCLKLLLSPEKARRPSQPRLSGTANGNQSSSYHLPSSLLPRSEPLLADFESGRHFERLLESTRAPPRGLPKSQTTPAILSPNKDIASHSLLKPLGPPLPRSNTLDDVSALLSPSVSPKRIRTESVRLCFGDDIVPKRVDIHLNRAKSPYPQSSVNTGDRALQSSCRTSNIALSTTDGTVASTTTDTAPSNTDPRFVYTYEISTYWTGRYVALMDRLRARTFTPPRSPKNSYRHDEHAAKRAPRPKRSTDFARIEIDIEKEAMKILRSFCQTKAATEGFERFEFLLRNKHFESLRRQGLPQPRPVADVGDRSGVMFNKRPTPAVNSKSERRMLSETLPQRIFRKTSSTIPKPKIEKSTTIGDFSKTNFYISSSPEEAVHENKLSQQDGSAVIFQGQIDRKHVSRVLPTPRVGPLRAPLRTPSPGRSNIEVARNFSHRDGKQTTTVTNDGSSSDIRPPFRAAAAAKQPLPYGPIDDQSNPSRRFRKSESIKQFVDFGIREVRKMSMGRRRKTSGSPNEIDED